MVLGEVESLRWDLRRNDRIVLSRSAENEAGGFRTESQLGVSHVESSRCSVLSSRPIQHK